MHNTTTHKAPNTRRGTPRQPYAALRPRFARHRHASFGSSKDSNYSYDAEIRLTQAQTDTGGLFGSRTETYTLDPLANRTRHSPVSGAWQYDANNRLIQRGEGGDATTYAWDEAGNQTQKTEAGNKTTRYGYDSNNRLIEVKDGTNNLIARYGYDPLGRRMWKEQYRDGQGAALPSQKRTYFLYADEGLIAEATQAIALNADNSVSENGTPQITAQYGPKPNNPYTTGMLFIKALNSNGTDTYAYYHHDHLQTPIQATDKQGNVVWAASYNAFGQATIITPAPTADKPTITSNLRLPGQYWDEETGLHYNYFRDYDPQVGRYTTSDPIGTVLYRDMAAKSLAQHGLMIRPEVASQLYRPQPEFNHPFAYVR
ncbi:MAG: RHS repeat-associated core domain-containing protein, partial [Sulfurimicrobium sp.]|nr:RHS repeat-associated core domain-containing protein [Sulfurimicrobium sp.]